MNEEEIIRKRLTVEGDSGQDDRRITGLLKTFLKWCDMNSLTEEENETTYQKMLFTLGQVEFSFMRTELVHNMNDQEKVRYDQLVSSIDKEIADTQVLIETLRDKLITARLVRQHRQEYDAMASVIQISIARKDSTLKIEQLEKQLEDLSARQGHLKDQLSLRRKQGYLLSFAIHQLLDNLDSTSTDDPHSPMMEWT